MLYCQNFGGNSRRLQRELSKNEAVGFEISGLAVSVLGVLKISLANMPHVSLVKLDFVTGNRQSGKSWLLNRLEKRETSGRGSALEYHFLNVHTDYRDASYAYQLATAGMLSSFIFPIYLF